MPQITIRHLEAETCERLKRQAERHGRSFEAELRAILRHAAKPSLDEMRERIEQFQQERYGDRVLSDSSELLREDRDR